jgi:peptide/nickel transport system substrate-binding protein
MMAFCRLLPAACCLAVLLCSSSVTGATLRWSSQGDYLSADPHAQNEGLNNNLNDEIFERLSTRAHDLTLQPSLAT